MCAVQDCISYVIMSFPSRRGRKPLPIGNIGPSPLHRGIGRVTASMKSNGNLEDRVRYRRMRDLNNLACRRHRLKTATKLNLLDLELQELQKRNRDLQLRVAVRSVTYARMRLCGQWLGILKLMVLQIATNGAYFGSGDILANKLIRLGLLVSYGKALSRLQHILWTLMLGA